MFLLIGSIVLASYLTLFFKVVERLRLNNLQVIVFNYITCVVTGSLLNGAFPLNRDNLTAPWFPWACAMGAVFIFLFNIIGYTAQQLGVAVTSVANKLSLVIPFLFSIYLYNEPDTILKYTGIALALVAVILTCYRPAPAPQKGISSPRSKYLLLLPVILFLGSGLLDTMIKYVESTFLNDQNKNDFIVAAFFIAALLGIITLVLQQMVKKRNMEFRAILAGIALGVPNYFSIWCLVKVLKQFGGKSSAIIPINNMGIVLFSAIVAWLVFGEKLLTINWIGVLLSMVAIALIAYG
ncbi:MAG TPA: hypothetical protein VM012_07820 [Flavitalea sp.]|nr:hypothetical protein [Flavitalea sp.]